MPLVLAVWVMIIGVALDDIAKSKGAVLSLGYKRKRKPKGG
jgi:hypothetical protein